ncbi:MAG: DUF6325 family protein [Pseudonocardia sp.]|nr:DUF6325 family protein [Pseudonocardia sp.]
MGVLVHDDDEAGPVDYLVVEFPVDRRTGEGLPVLVDLVDRGLIRVHDLFFARRDADGTTTGIALADLDGDGELDLAVFQGASSGLIGPEDLADLDGVLEPGSSAAILVYENLWAAPLTAALRRGGGRLVARGPIRHDALLAALDATEPAEV